MLAVKNFFLPERKAPDAPRFSRMPEAFLRSIRRRSLRVKRAKSLVVPEREKRKSDSFVNSQEWTISRSVPDLRLGIVGSLNSGKSALVHRYLTGSYMQEESPEGGRFKKEVFIDNQSYLLLIRDEGGPPQMQFAAWVDAVIFVFSLENEASFNNVYEYYNKLCNFRNSAEIPIILIGTQDSISERSPRIIDDSRARRLASDLKRCTYFETCATYGLNVEKVFQDACQKIVHHRISGKLISQIGSRQTTPQINTSNRVGLGTYHQNVNSNGYSTNNTSSATGGNLTLPHRHHVLSASSNHIPLKNSGDLNKWPPPQQPIPHIMANENNNIPKFVPPMNQQTQQPLHQQPAPNIENLVPLSLTSNQSKDSTSNSKCNSSGGSGDKVLVTPTSTPTTTRKNRRRSNLFITSSKKSEDKLKNEELGVGRSIPIKQGYLYKRSSKALNKEWKKKYVTLCNDGHLTYHPSLHDYMNDVHGKEIPIQCITVKVPGQKPRGSKSIITNSILTTSLFSSSSSTASTNGCSGIKTMLQNGIGSGNGISEGIGCLSLLKDNKKMIPNDKVQLTGYESLRSDQQQQPSLQTNSSQQTSGDEGIVMMSNSNSQTFLPSDGNGQTAHQTPNVKKRHKRMKSSGINKNADHNVDDSDGFEFYIVSLDSKQWHFEAANSEERDEWVAAIEQEIFKSLQGVESTKTKPASTTDTANLAAIRNRVPGNGFCADCGAINPEWASLNLGVLVCIECSGIHRNLGSHISKVRSLDLDDWPTGHLSVMLAIGNTLANSVWEENLVISKRVKPSSNSSREEKELWIRSKYEAKDFLHPLQCNIQKSIGSQIIDSVANCDMKKLIRLLAISNKEQINTTISSRDLRTPLHFACATGNLAIAQLLIWNHANIQNTDQEGRTCLAYAKAAASLAAAKVNANNINSQQPTTINSTINSAYNVEDSKALVELLSSLGCPDSAPLTSSGTLPRRRDTLGTPYEKL